MNRALVSSAPRRFVPSRSVALTTATIALQSAPPPPVNSAPRSHEAIRRAAEEFEAVFLQQMLEPMFAGIKTDGLFGGGQGEYMFRSLMTQEYGKTLARTGGIGLADSVMREMLRLQEAQ